MISDSDKNTKQLYNLAEQYGIPQSEITGAPIIILFNRYGNLVFHTIGFPSESSFPFIKGVGEVPVWNHFSSSKPYGEKFKIASRLRQFITGNINKRAVIATALQFL